MFFDGKFVVVYAFAGKKMMKRKTSEESAMTEKRSRADAPTRYEKELGASTYVVVNEYEREVYVHLRKFEIYSGKKYPTKRGAALTPLRWNEFIESLPVVEEHIKKLSKGEVVQYRHHLGGNWYVSVTSGFPCVDVRKFWMPEGAEELAPSRKGIALKIDQFKALLGIIGDVNSCIPEIADVVSCSIREDHQNQLGALRCSECNPNDFQNW
jgi:hypothetical protein